MRGNPSPLRPSPVGSLPFLCHCWYCNVRKTVSSSLWLSLSILVWPAVSCLLQLPRRLGRTAGCSGGAERVVKEWGKGFVSSKGSMRVAEPDCEFIAVWVGALFSICLPRDRHQPRNSYFSSPNNSWLLVMC